ncbi:MAG: DUF4365 domain-containing protein [Janthinobacterium lividum]
MPTAKKAKTKPDGKLRVRKHIIADLSANYVEKLALLNGFSIESFVKDYGYDQNIYTYNSKGEFENGNIYVQLKATDHIKYVNKKAEVSFAMRKQDLSLWSTEPYPVIIVIYDAVKEEAYWLYLQKHLKKLSGFDIDLVKKYFTLNIPVANKMDKTVFQEFRNFKISTLKEIENVITHQ